MSNLDKPFDITKAVDFSDADIASTWVDLGDGGFLALVDPKSRMPQMLLGGKGSGRTHLMRYYSYALQKIRAPEADKLALVRSAGYVGIFMRCEGLNAGRFDGKGQSVEAWEQVFAYYMDLWLGQIVVETMLDVMTGRQEFLSVESDLVSGICALFDVPVTPQQSNLRGIVDLFTDLRREVDLAVNNAALTRRMDGLLLRATRGRLVFGIPQLFSRFVSALADIQFVYLIDELENLTEAQQKYVNTLLREKQAPSSFKVGVRLYGFRTRQTLSAGEENRVGSEYDEVILDDQLRIDARYDEFARQLVAQRLRRAGYRIPEHVGLQSYLEGLFEEYPSALLEVEQTSYVHENYGTDDRPYLSKLASKLGEFGPQGLAPGVDSHDQVSAIVGSLKMSAYPLIEKLGVFMLYQEWAKGTDLVEAAREIAIGNRELAEGKAAPKHRRVLRHFKGDLLAQLLRECRQRQRYLGLQSFIHMSSGLPRHLLVVLKFVHRWALFQGEKPFVSAPVGKEAQRAGILQAANWFFEDARASGAGGEETQGAIERLARLFHELRYADKPVESSLATFSLDETVASSTARLNVQRARDTSLLVKVIGGSKGKDGVQAKYQLNPMLCPRYDLPLSRRGTIDLSAVEVEAIFGADSDQFEALLNARLERMNAPFQPRTKANRKPPSEKKKKAGQQKLPGL